MKKRITAVVLVALTAISVHTAFTDVENVRNSLTIGMAFPGAGGGCLLLVQGGLCKVVMI